MDRGDGAAVRLPESDRKTLAIQALAGSETVSDLAARHGVSRKLCDLQRQVAALLKRFVAGIYHAGRDRRSMPYKAGVASLMRRMVCRLVLISRARADTPAPSLSRCATLLR